MKYAFAFLAILFFPNSAPGQETDKKHYGSWNTITLTANIESDFYIKSEFNIRRTNFLNDWEQFILRPSLHFKLDEYLDFSIGYSYIKNYSYSDFSTPIDVHENNIWQQLIIKQPFEQFSLLHRLRFEERFIDNLVTDSNGLYKVNGIKKRNRFRYRFVVDVPLKTFENGKKLSLVTYDEVLIGFGNGLRPKALNQNWMFFGLSYKVNKNWKLRSGYHDIYVKAASNTFITNHIWETTLTYKII